MPEPLLLSLNHLRVRTSRELHEWALMSFGQYLNLQGVDASDPAFRALLFERIGESKKNFAVKERFRVFMSREVRAELHGPVGWRQAAGFHLFREHLVSVRFE